MKSFHLVIGLGKTGLSCVRHLVQQGLSVAVMDTRAAPPGLAEFRQEFPTVPIYLATIDDAVLLNAAEVVVSPGISLEEPVIAKTMQQGIPVIGDIEIFVRLAKAPIVGITGTNAKGTVTTLVGEMVKCANLNVLVGGNIGTPVLDLLLEPTPDFYVLELSSFQLETTYSLRACAATILNISNDHLDRHKTMAAYIAAKQRIYQNCAVIVCNRDDLNTLPDAAVAAQVISFGFGEPKPGNFGLRDKDGKYWLAFGAEHLLCVNDLFIQGKHNWMNALAALALGHAMHLPMSAMLTAVKNFKGLPHRCEWVAEHDGVVWYNDSKGTNVGATCAAIQGLGAAITGKLILIAGGLGKGADFTVLKAPVAAYVKAIVLLGQDAQLIDRALQDVVAIHHVKNMQEAVAMAARLAQAGDMVLLSPACASWDMYKHFEERGDHFKTIVRGLSV